MNCLTTQHKPLMLGKRIHEDTVPFNKKVKLQNSIEFFEIQNLEKRISLLEKYVELLLQERDWKISSYIS